MSLLGWIAVGLLGGVAAAARFAIDTAVKQRMDLRAVPPGEGSSGRVSRFPLGIFVVNISGSLALGLVAGAALHGEALVIVAGGCIGSFTTFSTWILDSHRLAEAGEERLAWLNIGLSLATGFVAVCLGHWLGQVL